MRIKWMHAARRDLLASVVLNFVSSLDGHVTIDMLPPCRFANSYMFAICTFTTILLPRHKCACEPASVPLERDV